jgi:hypothetical protein
MEETEPGEWKRKEEEKWKRETWTRQRQKRE